jgi:phage gp29-like protein
MAGKRGVATNRSAPKTKTAAPSTNEVAVAQLHGSRSLMFQPVAPGLNPAALGHVLHQAGQLGGDFRPFLTLAEEMEERDAHYRSVMSTRKLALRSIEPVATPKAERGKEAEAAADIQSLADSAMFRTALMNLADAVAKGFSVVEIGWERTTSKWAIGSLKWRDPRLFDFDRVTGEQLLLRTDTAFHGEELEPFKFIVHVPTLKSGRPIRNGVARVAVWSFMLKSFSMKDWAAFLEVYGIPIRVGKYGPGASDEEKRTLLRAVATLASDAGVIIPESMIIDLLETKGSGSEAHEKACRYLDEQLSKVVVGQTMTADNGSSKAQAEVHERVRLEIRAADADELAATLQRDLVEPYCALNYGLPPDRCPILSLPVEAPADQVKILEAVEKFVNLGGEVDEAEVRELIGFAAPAKGARLLTKTRGSSQKAADTGLLPTSKALARACRCADCGGFHAVALNAQEDVPIADLLADLNAGFVPDLARSDLGRMLGSVSSLEELRNRLPELLDGDVAGLADRLATAALIARARGNGT